jgi:hypothetical protein
MKPEYVEGPKAAENFEQGMKALFKVPKDEVVQPKKRGKAVSSRPRRRSPMETRTERLVVTLPPSPSERGAAIRPCL